MIRRLIRRVDKGNDFAEHVRVGNAKACNWDGDFDLVTNLHRIVWQSLWKSDVGSVTQKYHVMNGNIRPNSFASDGWVLLNDEEM